MNNYSKIWLSSPHMGGKESQYVQDAFRTNWIAPVGPYIDEFEKQLSYISLDHHVVALSSGTAAIHLALILLGIKKDDNVICSSFTFSATVNPVCYLNANPILIDSERETWNMCPELLESAIIEGVKKNKKPKAIILVHLYGMPAKIAEIVNIASKYEIPIIEDAAEALGSKYQNKPLGTFGDIGIYSFNGNKIITTSGGGALLSKNKDITLKAKYFATQARDEKPYYEHSNIGYNYRLSNVCAAIGVGQLEYLEDRVKEKRIINSYYREELGSITDISFIQEPKKSFSNYWLTTILLAQNSAIDKEKLRLYLEKENIETRPLWKPMHLQPIFKDCKSYVNGVSKEFFDRGICLPSGTNMKEEQLKHIVKKIKQLYEA